MVSNILWCKKNFEEVHDRSLEEVRSVLDSLVSERGLNVDYTARETVRRADFMEPDLVIVLGGDGTLTSIAHSVDGSTPVMGVNSHPRDEDDEGSYGFYMGSDPSTFAEDVRAAIDGRAIVNVLPRLQAEIETTSGNVIRCDPALNDLLVANTHQYSHPSTESRGEDRLHAALLGMPSRPSSDRVPGSGTWLTSRGQGSISEIDDHNLYVARDLPRSDRVDDGSYWEWVSEPTVITSDMHRGYVVSDGWDETHFTRGATLTVGLNGPSLRLLTFRGEILDGVTQWISDA